MDFYDQYEIDYHDEICKKLDNFLNDTMYVNIDITDIKVGQEVFITFIPNSQKYIYNLHPKFGKIHFVPDKFDLENFEDFISRIKIINHEGKLENLFHPSVSYYGDSLGYSYIIKEVTRL